MKKQTNKKIVELWKGSIYTRSSNLFDLDKSGIEKNLLNII